MKQTGISSGGYRKEPGHKCVARKLAEIKAVPSRMDAREAEHLCEGHYEWWVGMSGSV